MFKALADEQQRAVPDVRKRRVRVEREGASIMAGDRIAGTGYNE
jgi:hypothetical protein